MTLAKINNPSRGDTLVEVILSIALIASAISVAISLSHHNLQTAINAQARSQALTFATDQVERLKNAYLNNPSKLNEYTKNPGVPFCVLGDGSREDAAAQNQNSKCLHYNGTQFSVTVQYTAASRLFSVTTTWRADAKRVDPDRLSLYYKLPGA